MSLYKSKLGKAFSVFGMFAIVAAAFAFVVPAKAALEYDYTWKDQTQNPTVAQYGESTITVWVYNTGTATWYNSGTNPVRFGATQPQDRRSGFYNANDWIGRDRATDLDQASVPPCNGVLSDACVGSFTFDIYGGAFYPGMWPNEHFNLVVEDMFNGWMPDKGIYFDINMTAPGAGATLGYDAEIVGDLPEITVDPGSTANVSIEVKNVGTQTWYNDSLLPNRPYPIHIGTWNAKDRSSDFYASGTDGWLNNNRVSDMTDDTLQPYDISGLTTTFDFQIKAPSNKAEGTYTENFNFVTENLQWMDVPFSLTIHVGPGGSTGDVTVSLATDTPVGDTIPKGATGVEMAKFKVTGTGTIDSLTIHHFGVGATTAFDNVYLYEGATRLTNGRSVSSADQNVEFNNLEFEVDGTHYLTVVADFTATATGQHGFEIVSADDVALAGVGGSFPIQGELFAIGDEAVSTVIITASTNPANPTVGSHAELAKFKVENGANDTTLERITLIQTGDIANSDLTDLELYQGSDLLASTATLTASTMSSTGDKIVFDLDTPYQMPDGTSRIFTVMGTTAGRSGRTVQMYLEYTSDMLIIDDLYGYGAQVTNDYDGATSWSEVTLQGGEVTIAYSGPTTGDIAKGGQDQLMLNFAISSSDRDIDVKKLSLTLAGDDLEDGATDLFSDIKIRETDSSFNVAGTQSVGSTLMGPKAICNDGNDAVDITTCTLDYTDSFIVDGGTTRYMQVTWDVANNIYFDGNNRSYRATIEMWTGTSFKYTDTNQYVPTGDIVPLAAYTGNWQTVKGASLAVGMSNQVISSNVVTNQKDADGVAFTLTTGSEAVNISDMAFTAYVDNDGAGVFATPSQGGVNVYDVVTKVKLYADSDLLATWTQLDGSKTINTTTGRITFTGLDLDIPGSTGAVIKLVFDVGSSAPYPTPATSTNRIKFDIDDASADITATDTENNTVTATNDDPNGATADNGVRQTILGAGQLTIERDGNSPQRAIISSNTAKVEVAKFKFTSIREAMKVKKFGVNVGSLATYPDAVNTLYLNAGGSDIAHKQADLSDGGNNWALWDLDSTQQFVVPKDGSLVVTIYASTATMPVTGDYSGHEILIAANDQITGITNPLEAYGDASGQQVLYYSNDGHVAPDAGVEATGYNQVIHKTKISQSKVSADNSTLTTGTGKEVYRFTVSADSAGDAYLGAVKIDFTDSIAGFNPANWKLIDVNDSTFTYNGTINGAEVYFNLTGSANGTRTIGAGSSRTFKVVCDLAGALANGDSLSVWMDKEVTTNNKGTFAGVPFNAGANYQSFVWSDSSIIPHSDATADFFNDYLVDLNDTPSTQSYNL